MNRSLSKVLALAALCGFGGILPSLSQGAAIPRAPAWWGSVLQPPPGAPVAAERLHPTGPAHPAFVPPPSLAWRPAVRPAQRVQGYRFRPLAPAGRSHVPSAAPLYWRQPVRAAQRLQGYRFRPLEVSSGSRDRRRAGAPATAAPAPGVSRFARTLPAPWPGMGAFRFRPMVPPHRPVGWRQPVSAGVAWLPGARRYQPYGAPLFRPRMFRDNPYPVAWHGPRAGIPAVAITNAEVPQRPAPVFRFRPLARTSPIVHGRGRVAGPSLASRPFSGPAVPGYRRTGPPPLPRMGWGTPPVYRFRPLRQPTDRLAGRYRGVPAPVAVAGSRNRFPVAAYRYRPDPRFARVPGHSIHEWPDGGITADAPGWTRSPLPWGHTGTAAGHDRLSERGRSRGRADHAVPDGWRAASPTVAQAEQGAAGMIRPWIAGPVSTE